MPPMRIFCRPLGRLVIAAVAFAATAADAAVYTITTLADDDTDNGNCTLREALLAASTDQTNDLCIGDIGADTIVLDAVGTYSFTLGSILSAARQFTVRGDADQPASAYVIDLGSVQRFLAVSFGSDLTLENLTLTHGAGSPRGGALLVENSDLTMRQVTISDSDATHASAADGGALAFLAQDAQSLDLEEVTFTGNRAAAVNQTFGGALYATFQDGGSARIVRARIAGNRLEATTGSFSRKGGGIFLQAFTDADDMEIELRHLELTGNAINGPSFSDGAGASIYMSAAGTLLLEDALLEDNELEVAAATNGSSALDLDVAADSATIRRVRMVANPGDLGSDHALIQFSGPTQAVLSDLLVANGSSNGLWLTTSGADCDVLAGNLTVAGHPQSGLVLIENGCPLRIENSIVFGNATSSGSNLDLFAGSPEVSAECLVGVDPLFLDGPNGDFRLDDGSPAEDAGDQTFASIGPFDAAHATRVVGVDVDLGALERGAVFADGFEYGDVHAWTSTVP